MTRSTLPVIWFLVLAVAAACQSPDDATPADDPSTWFLAGEQIGPNSASGKWELLDLEAGTGWRVIGLPLPAPERTTVRALYHALFHDGDGPGRPLPVAGFVQDVRLFARDRALAAILDADGKLWLWDVRSGAVSALAEGVFPGFSFSPDGQRLAFSAGHIPDLDLYVMTLDSREVVRLAHENGPATGPAFSPDGTEVAFVSSIGGYASIAAVPVTGGGRTRRLTNRDLPTDGSPVHSSRQAPFPESRRPMLWTSDGLFFEHDRGVIQLSEAGSVVARWPGARFPVGANGRVLHVVNGVLRPLTRPEVAR